MVEHMIWFPGTCLGTWLMGATENRRNCVLLSDSILWVLVPPTKQKETHTTQILNTKWCSQCLLIAIKYKIIVLFQANAAIKTKQQPKLYTRKSSLKTQRKKPGVKKDDTWKGSSMSLHADFPSQERSFIASISRSNKGTVRQAAIASERKIKVAQSDYFS